MAVASMGLIVPVIADADTLPSAVGHGSEYLAIAQGQEASPYDVQGDLDNPSRVWRSLRHSDHNQLQVAILLCLYHRTTSQGSDVAGLRRLYAIRQMAYLPCRTITGSRRADAERFLSFSSPIRKYRFQLVFLKKIWDRLSHRVLPGASGKTCYDLSVLEICYNASPKSVYALVVCKRIFFRRKNVKNSRYLLPAIVQTCFCKNAQLRTLLLVKYKTRGSIVAKTIPTLSVRDRSFDTRVVITPNAA